MPATEPRYLTSLEAGYETTFEAEVVALPPGGVVLSESLFYPVGGGQPADRGTLTTAQGQVVDVVDVTHQGGATLHRLGRKVAPVLQRGQRVRGEIDWNRRFTHMRLHTAQHLLSALAYRRWGIRTDGARLSGRSGYLDLERPPERPEMVEELLREGNDSFFSRHVPVTLRFVSREEFATLPNRSGSGKLPTGVERVRLVVIGDADLAPCGGTHLLDTAQVGGVRGLPTAPLPAGGLRISFELSADVPLPEPRRPGSSTPIA